MAALRGKALVAQSGGPTTVINASLCGVIQEAMRSGVIESVYGAHNGILGVLTEDLFDITKEGAGDYRGLEAHAVGGGGVMPVQAQVARGEPAGLRAGAGGIPRAQYPLLLLHRRKRLDGHGRQARATGARAEVGAAS